MPNLLLQESIYLTLCIYFAVTSVITSFVGLWISPQGLLVALNELEFRAVFDDTETLVRVMVRVLLLVLVYLKVRSVDFGRYGLVLGLWIWNFNGRWRFFIILSFFILLIAWRFRLRSYYSTFLRSHFPGWVTIFVYPCYRFFSFTPFKVIRIIWSTTCTVTCIITPLYSRIMSKQTLTSSTASIICPQLFNAFNQTQRWNSDSVSPNTLFHTKIVLFDDFNWRILIDLIKNFLLFSQFSFSLFLYLFIIFIVPHVVLTKNRLTPM